MNFYLPVIQHQIHVSSELLLQLQQVAKREENTQHYFLDIPEAFLFHS